MKPILSTLMGMGTTSRALTRRPPQHGHDGTTQQGQGETTRAGEGPLCPFPTIGVFFKIILL